MPLHSQMLKTCSKVFLSIGKNFHFQMRKLTPEGLKNEFVDAFNFDNLGSDDEIPEQL